MRTTLLKSLALLAVALLCAPPTLAQVRSDPKPVPAKSAAPAAVPSAPKPPAAPSPPAPTTSATVPARPAPTKADVPARPASSSPKLSVLETPACSLEEAVERLQVELQRNNMEPLNILFGPDTKELEVSSLNLRNITGQDALHLIAAAANCTVETMTSKEAQGILVGYSPAENAVYAYPQKIIGYMFSAKLKQAQLPPGMGSPGIPRMVPGGRSAATASTTGRLTRIYPLGSITGLKASLPLQSSSSVLRGIQDRYFQYQITIADMEKTLRDTLKADNVAENQVTLAFHEKSNVLVVSAAEPVHVLVEQLVTALKSNAEAAEAKNLARDTALGKSTLEPALRRSEQMERELSQRDAELRELQKELRRLQDAGTKPPSAK